MCENIVEEQDELKK